MISRSSFSISSPGMTIIDKKANFLEQQEYNMIYKEILTKGVLQTWGSSSALPLKLVGLLCFLILIKKSAKTK